MTLSVNCNVRKYNLYNLRFCFKKVLFTPHLLVLTGRRVQSYIAQDILEMLDCDDLANAQQVSDSVNKTKLVVFFYYIDQSHDTGIDWARMEENTSM